ncbi:hypothetical protein M0812_13452 [Anaeramoeba flamelloides]|uniref:Homeobox domain-containing protein n=1 Tax=Anaeramoeba flamelloides TaxID=1746091 RepID=A0AAV7ZJL3_9EUKA|nr:hypothetical protein M0812_13452 [Anaeramoeba flamelloides]
MSTKFSEYMDLELETDLLRELSLTPFLPSSEVFFKSHLTNETPNKTDKIFQPIDSFTHTQIKMSMFNRIKNEETSNSPSDQQNNYENNFFENGTETLREQNQNQIEMGQTLNNGNNYNFPKSQKNEMATHDSQYLKFFRQEKNECETSTTWETPMKFEVPKFEDQLVFGEQKNFDFCFENKINKQNYGKYSNIDIDELLTDNYNNLSESTIPTNTELGENSQKNLMNYCEDEDEDEGEAENENENEHENENETENENENENEEEENQDYNPRDDNNRYSFSITSFQQQNLSRKERSNSFKSKQNPQGTNLFQKERFKNYKKNRKKYFKDKKGIVLEDGWGQKTYQILPGDKFGLRILKKKRRTRKKRQNITEHARKILEKWFKRHSKDQNGPYPDRITRIRLGMRTNTPELQVQRWFGQRRRIEKSRWENGEICKPCWI